MTDVLERAIFSRQVAGEQPAEGLDVRALSANLTLEEALAWRNFISLEPLLHRSPAESQAVGIFHGPGSSFILARAHTVPDDDSLQLYECICIPGDLLGQLAGDLDPLLGLIEDPVPAYPAGEVASIPPLDAPRAGTWTDSKRLALFSALYAERGDIHVLLALLGAALDERYLLVKNFPGDFQKQIELVQGLMMLLPSSVRSELTFSTHVIDVTSASTRVVFCDDPGHTRRWVADFEAGTFPADAALEAPYVKLLAELWNGDPAGFLGALRPFEATARYLVTGSNLVEGLTRVAERHLMDMRILEGEPIPIETVKAVLTDEAPLEGEVQLRYAETLLRHALSERDAEAASLVAHYMDDHPEVDQALERVLGEEIESQPDAVYVFIRARLSEKVDPRWLPRLAKAAERSLEVAVQDGDSSTVSGWLKLISREPPSYDLGRILHRGVLAAQTRAHDSGDLASQLILLAVKRDPDALDALLEDEALLAALSNHIGRALRDYDPEAVLALHSQGREIFLVALARATRARARDVFRLEIVERFWEIYTGEQPSNLPEHYLPESILAEWIDHGVEWLPSEALESLLALALAAARDDLFYQLTHRLSQHQALFPLLSAAMQRSGRSVADILSLVGQLVTAGDISQQQALNTYIALLTAWEWPEEAFPLVEQAARLIQHSPTLTVTPEVCWHLLDVAAEARSEPVARAAASRLLPHVQSQTDEAALVGLLLHLYSLVQWSQPVRQKVMGWWREFVRSQALVNLQQFDKALEGKRALEEARSVVQTVVAVRKVLGKRTLEEFAQAIDSAYNILQAMSDSFDPSSKQPLDFDQATVRAELDARQDELTPERRKLLAKNLKELAQTIAEMADRRSKTPLMRREEDFERQMMSGEQQPQSAVDTLKWMSGYLNGAQDKAEESNE